MFPPEAEGSGRAVRAAHANSYGLVKAEVGILASVPAPYAQGIYARPGRHDVLIRFSGASGHLAPDAQLGNGLGFALTMFDVDGPKLVDEEPDATTFDFVLKNIPVFIANTAKHYSNVGLQEDGATFTIPQDPVRRRIHDVRAFNVLCGGEYFFLPSLSALRWMGDGFVRR